MRARHHRERVASLAACLVMLATSAAARACPGTPNGVDPEPYPRVTSYSVTRESGPPTERNKAGNEVTVIGGHPIDGRFRFEIRLDRDVPSHCPIRFELIDPTEPMSNRAPGVGAAVLRAVSLETLRDVLDVNTDGTSRLVVIVRSRPAFSRQRHDLTFRLGGETAGQPAHRFTLVRQPNGAVALTTSAATVAGGPANQIDVTATLPATIDATAMDEREMVEFAVIPPDAGGFRTVGNPNTTNEGNVPISTTLSPMRASIKFVPAAVTQTTVATLRAELLGTRVERTISITPDASSCRPEASYAVEPGVVVVSIVNRGRTACPRFTVSMRDWTGQRVLGPATIEPLQPAPIATPGIGLRGALVPRGLPATIKPLPTPVGAGIERFEGRFQLGPRRAAAGAEIRMTLTSASNTLPPITLAPFAFTAADVAALSGS